MARVRTPAWPWLVLALSFVASVASAQDADAEPVAEEAPDEPVEVEAGDPASEAPTTEPATEQPAESDSTEAPETAETSEPETERPADEGFTFGARIGGEYQHRFAMMSTVPVAPLPRTDPAETGTDGRSFWGEQWLRLRGEMTLRPILRLVGELDLLFGVAYGDLPVGMAPAVWPQEAYGYPGLRLRQLYLEWLSPIGLFRVGQMGFSWGLGIISNGGSDAPLFGDYRFGDLVRRILFATRPGGAESPFTIAVAADWVAWDLVADFQGRGDLAFQGVLAGYYEQDEDRLGAYVAYRHQSNPLDDTLEVFIGDLFGQMLFPEPTGGRILTAFELVYIRGTTTYARTVVHPVHEVEQLMAVVRVGRKEANVDIILEGGYASGDSNPEDAFQRRGTMDPDHRVGLILFPEVLAAQTARSAHLATSPELFGRPARGAALLPTNGSVAGAYYLFPYVLWRPLEWLEARAAAVLAWASADVVDPFAQRARSRAQNYLGGDPTARDLGLELDAAVRVRGTIAEGVTLSGGIEGGVLFPGHAFADANGVPMPTVGMARFRFGISY